MRSSSDYRILVGVAFILFGGLLLLQTMGILEIGGLIWAVILGILGVGFLVALVQDHSRWWAAIPGMTLLGLATVIALGELAPRAEGAAGGAIFLGSISLAFWVVYLLRRDFWWAIIPGGVLATLALVAGVSERLPGVDTGAIFFLGLGTTFLILYLLPQGLGRQTWAIFPAGGLGLVGLAIGLFSGSVARFVWPVLLILIGLFFIARAAMGRRTV